MNFDKERNLKFRSRLPKQILYVSEICNSKFYCFDYGFIDLRLDFFSEKDIEGIYYHGFVSWLVFQWKAAASTYS